MSTWSGLAEAYRRSFATLCAGTIETLLDATDPGPTGPQGVGPGATDAEGATSAAPTEAARVRVRHLDVGCGTGELARAAAGRGRAVVAADPDPDMIAAARAATAGEGEVTLLRAGSPVLPLPDASVDAITANFVVNHVGDPRATVRDLARIAAVSAPIALTIWPADPGPHLAAYGQAAERAGALAVPSTRLAPELDFPRSVDGLAALAEESGLQVVEARELSWTWMTTADVVMAGIAGGVATPGRIHRAQTRPVRARIERHVRELWSPWAVAGAEGMLAFPVSSPLVLAMRA